MTGHQKVVQSHVTAVASEIQRHAQAHQIANDHEGTVIGNWLHAIAHRREPDASNSKYWYHRVEGPANGPDRPVAGARPPVKMGTHGSPVRDRTASGGIATFDSRRFDQAC